MEDEGLVERATRLFEFLGRVQRLKETPCRTTGSYESVFWFGELPDHPCIDSSHAMGDPMLAEHLLSVDRVPRIDPPQPPEVLTGWLDGDLSDPEDEAALRETIPAAGRPDLGERQSAFDGWTADVRLDDHPEVRDAFTHWFSDWRDWASAELQDRPVRALYGELFSTYVNATSHPEEVELVLGVGCLAWSPDGHPPVHRHLFTCPAVIHFDDETGRLTVVNEPGAHSLNVELDMLEPGLITNPGHVNELKAEVTAFEGHPLDPDGIGMLARRLVHTLDAEGEYRHDVAAPQSGSHAVAAYAPAVILRKRSQRGLVEIFDSIVAQLGEAGEVPSGLLPLIDPEHRPHADIDSSPGAVVDVDDEPFLPLPVNERQLRVVRAVDDRAQIVVQGPPGTGKTHTAAALLSHLLAQGKRVLVTAQTDRALQEVRDKLPAAIRPLSVAVVGTSRSDMADLKMAVDTIAARASEHVPAAAEQEIESTLAAIDELRRRRAAIHRELLDAREHEVATHEHGLYEGTLAGIAQRFQADAAIYDWIAAFAEVVVDSKPPLSDVEIVEWLIRDSRLATDEADAHARLIEFDSIPDPQMFANMCAVEAAAGAVSRQHDEMAQHEAYESIGQLAPDVRSALQVEIRALADEASALEQRHEAWMNEAVFDVRAGRGHLWYARDEQIDALIERAQPLIDKLGPVTQVDISGGDLDALCAIAHNLWRHLSDGGSIKVSADGTPRVGMLTARPVKEGVPLFDHVRVDGRPPATIDQLDAFLTHTEAQRLLDALDRAWPANVRVPPEDTLHERLQWHVTELAQLKRVRALGNSLAAAERRFQELGVKPPTWTDLETVRAYASLVDATAAKDALTLAAQPLVALGDAVASTARWDDAASCIHQLNLAVRSRDHDQYAQAYRRITRLYEVRRFAARRDELRRRLDVTPDLRSAIQQSPDDACWDSRLASLESAWAWAATGAWILGQHTADVNVLQAQISAYESRIRREVETLAATRAWSHAVSSERITGQTQADLAQYAFLVRRLGKGTGKYAAQRRAEIRRAMKRCRPAVPVWIMPLYRIAEQFHVQENMFDVIIVDEASQAGLEATFLQYLAPKIVVIGDDKQVSPAGVGIDQQQLRDLARQYLADDRYKDSWQDPTRSLFDEAVMRYGGKITLVEHRRCVPEIIGFSNRIAYEPDGVRLVPVRQYGADRLEPIRPVHVRDGYQRGRTNPAEVDAICEQIVQCLNDPRYDGLTFGVISLLGPHQAKAIQNKLLAEQLVTPEQWAARDLRCGDAADFQGSERDVMFLSMVAAPEPGRRPVALTREQFVQRYNVAASRAKDQMWVYHSVNLQDLGNPEDMRHQLLDYCYGVLDRGRTEDDRVAKQAVPDDIQVDPFDSLFEQRVFNRLFDRGYTVIPQYPAEGYRIDLVVVGPTARVAVECDGDRWHGPDEYERDLARQRDLERCGWQFFRVRESAFYVDQATALDGLWRKLGELDIRPSGWTTADVDRAGDERQTPDQEEALAAVDDVELEWEPVEDRGGTRTDPDGIDERDPEPSPLVMSVRGENDDLTVYEPSTTSDEMSDTDAPGTEVDLEPYSAFSGNVAAPLSASRQQLIEGILAIVAAEGPVVGHRIHTAFIRAAGEHRVGRAKAKVLNSAITSAVRRGHLVADGPLGEVGVKLRTYRLPEQAGIRPRHLGPRTLDQIPPDELAELLRKVGSVLGPRDDETLFRTALGALGLRRLTTNVEIRLRSVLPLAQDGIDGARSLSDVTREGS